MAVRLRPNSAFIDSLKIGVALFLLGSPSILVIAIGMHFVTGRPTSTREYQPSPLNTSKPRSSERGGTVATVTARQPISEFKANQLLANQQSKGLTAEVRGQITAIGVEVIGRPYYLLDEGVRVVFKSGGSDRPARFGKGEIITALCESPSKLVHVVMTGCLF